VSRDPEAADTPTVEPQPHGAEPQPGGERGAGFAVTHDPFEPHLRFAGRTGMRLRPWMDRPGPRPLEPIDTHADKFVDFDVLEALASFRGLFKLPVEMHPDNYPSSVQDQMRELEPQFILRNLGRVERMDEGQGRLPLQHDRPAPGIDIDAIAELRSARYEPPELLEETNLDVVSSLTAFRRHLYRDVRWERHFSREIREDFDGPMWRYEPPPEEPAEAPPHGDGSPGDEPAGGDAHTEAG